MTILDEIVREKKKVVAKAKRLCPLDKIRCDIGVLPQTRPFARDLRRAGRISLIAEIKRASPSTGIIRPGFNPLDIALAYAQAGANCLSVLTEKKFFLGRLEYIAQIKSQVNLSILRKDFIVDEYQIYESRRAGADAILLISRLFVTARLRRFIRLARGIGLACLVECDSRRGIKNALSAEAEIIGINNRNLSTLRVDINNAARLIRYIPRDKIIVSESGVKSRKDVEYLGQLGADAVLVGEALMRSKDIRGKVKELFGDL